MAKIDNSVIDEDVFRDYDEGDDGSQEIEVVDNAQLAEVLDFYDCYHLLSLAKRILWLSGVKEAIGCIPSEIKLDYSEICLLVVLQEEQGKKMSWDNLQVKKSGSGSGKSGSLGNAIIEQ